MVFRECAWTPFFPCWSIDDETELHSYFNDRMPHASVEPLVEQARRLQVAFAFGYAELERRPGPPRRSDTFLLVSPRGNVIHRYHKIHPGYVEPRPAIPFQNLEKRHFNIADLGFPVGNLLGTSIGKCACNDRRRLETYRVMGLAAVEFIVLGHNIPSHTPATMASDRLARFHNLLAMQAGAYHNSTWVCAAAKADTEGGVHQIGDSCVIAPSGEVIAEATSEDDETVAAEIDLSLARRYKAAFGILANRQPQHYAEPATFEASGLSSPNRGSTSGR